MKNIVRGLAIDNGGSEVRMIPVGGNDEVFTLDSDFIQIDESAFRPKDVEPEHVIRVIKAPSKDYQGLYAVGSASLAYEGESLVLDNQKPKTSNTVYYKQFIFSLASDVLKAFKEYKAYYSMHSEQVDGKRVCCAGLLFNYAIATCIPVKEHSGVKDCASLLKEGLKGEYIVEFPLLEDCLCLKFIINEKYIGVVPEGGVAIIGLGKELDEEDYSITIDMGHVTTDIALFKGKSMLGRVVSSSYAGGTLMSNVRAALREEGYQVSESQMFRVMRTGIVRKGATEVNVVSLIEEQKKLFVNNYLKGEVLQVLNMNAVNSTQVQNVIPIGRPMNTVEGTKSISDFIIDSCGFKDANVRVLADDLRLVNVQSAVKFAKMLTARASKEVS